MATSSYGVLLKLLNASNSGSKPKGEHRSSLLQVTDIVPIDLDQKTLIPRRGFYIKLSDSSHYIYANLPFDELDLVLTNKLQLGQYIYIERLEPGSPVPVAKGIKLINGRHPLIGTPKPLTGFRSHNEKLSTDRRRGSWKMNIDGPVVLKNVPLNFDQFTPVKDKLRSLPKINALISPIVRGRLSIGGDLMPKIEKQPERQKRRESSVLLKRNSVTPASMSKTILQSRITNTSLAFNSSSVAEVKSCTNQLNQIVTACVTVSSDLVVASESQCGNNAMFISNCDTGSGSSLSLSGKLGILGKEVVQQRESAQEIAIQALSNVSASENILRYLEMFADMSKRSKPEAPASCLEEFLEFHSQITRAVTNMVSTQATTGSSLHETKQEESKDSILHETKPNSMDHLCIKEENNPSRGRPVLCKSSASGRVLRSSSKAFNKVVEAPKDDENKKHTTSRSRKTSASRCCLSNMIRLGKQIEIESGKWFMEFLEKTLETGFKMSKGKLDDGDMKKVPQSLMMRVINWIEVQKCDPKATQMTRKLRIKMKNPREDIQSETKYSS